MGRRSELERFRKYFGQQSSSHGPFAADADGGKEAEDVPFPEVGGEAGECGEYAVHQNRQRHRGLAAEAVGDRAPDGRAAPAEQEYRGADLAVPADIGGRGRDVGARQQGGHGRGEDESEDGPVESVHGPAAEGAPEGTALGGGEPDGGVGCGGGLCGIVVDLHCVLDSQVEL